MNHYQYYWEILTGSKLIETLGWTLLHSVWQIALVALVLFLLLRVLQKFSANARYTLAAFALALALVLPIATFISLNGSSASNFFRGEALTEPEDEQFRPPHLPLKNAPLPTGAEMLGTDAGGKNVFASIETLQDFFDKNLSDVLPFFVGLWFLGVAFFAVRMAGGVWQLHLYKTREIAAPDAEWLERFSVLCEKLKIRQSVKFLKSELIRTPIVIGWLKPVILVPAGVFLQISPHELETVIAHELVHIRRYDALVNFAQSIVETLFFYHPCVWWISAVVRKEREFATDEAVVKILENSHIVYASALANLEEIRLSANQNLPPFSTAAVKGGNLMQRITKILQKNTETRARANSAWSAGLALMLISAVLLAVFSFNQPAFVNAQQAKTKNRKLAIGFVSIPPLDRTANAPKDADATARLLIEALKARKIPAIGFVHGQQISDGEKFYPVRANIVRLWRDSGFEIGIGGYKHVWFYHTPYEEFVAGVEKNETVVRKLLAEKNLPLRYFSYPYLNTGKTAEERNRFESWLQSRGIAPVKYTIDNQEWMYSYAYDMARNDNDVNTMREIRAAFIDYMTKMFDHYEAYSQELFGRDINQTMVLTPSRLITDSADELFGMIEKRGYRFVSMEEALTDEAYRTEENFYGKAGISWFERWQMAKGKKLRDEPEVDAAVQKIWDENKSRK
ncbi:MAG: polysaccharide deacetylase family protein [Acidobacteriota bacterium]|nr:polysaccharide deacetylase family protein [Acidobacteriota bacterium]